MTVVCIHDGYVSSTYERGPYCCECNEPLVGLFSNISRNTPAGALLWAMKNSPSSTKEWPIAAQGASNV